jgi:hypothetical protein
MVRRICPRCGSKKVAKILYGMPAMGPELEEQLSKGEIVLGGCCITGCDPAYHCNKCKKDFGAPTAALEVETTSFHFSIGGYFDGYQSLTVTKTENGAVMVYLPGHLLESETIEKQLSADEWLSFIHRLYRCYIADWKKRYIDPHVLDGTQWELIVTFLNGKSLKIYGSNSYPIHWSKLLRAIKTVGVSLK